MLTVVIIIKALLEVAGFTLLGQGVLYVLAGAQREHNVFYQILKTVASPVIRVTRFITPRFVADRHIGVAAFFLTAGLWLAVTLIKIQLVLGTAGAAH